MQLFWVEHACEISTRSERYQFVWYGPRGCLITDSPEEAFLRTPLSGLSKEQQRSLREEQGLGPKDKVSVHDEICSLLAEGWEPIAVNSVSDIGRSRGGGEFFVRYVFRRRYVEQADDQEPGPATA